MPQCFSFLQALWYREQDRPKDWEDSWRRPKEHKARGLCYSTDATLKVNVLVSFSGLPSPWKICCNGQQAGCRGGSDKKGDKRRCKRGDRRGEEVQEMMYQKYINNQFYLIIMNLDSTICSGYSRGRFHNFNADSILQYFIHFSIISLDDIPC